MGLQDGFPSASGLASANDIRLGLAGLIVRDTSGNPRTGILARHANALVTSTATMNSSVAAFEAVVSRPSQGVILLPNDGSTNVLHDAAPAANKRLDLIYVKQNDAVAPNADADNLPKFGILKGAASATPTPYTFASAKAALAAAVGIGPGAEPLAVVEIPSTATTMQSGGVIYTQLHQYTTMTGGVIPVRNATELAALTGYAQGTFAYQIDNGVTYRYYDVYHAGNNPTGRKTAGWKPWETSVPVAFTGTPANFVVAGAAVLTQTWTARAGRILVEGNVSIGAGGGFTGNMALMVPSGVPAADKYIGTNDPLGRLTYLVPGTALYFATIVAGATTDRVTPIAENTAATYNVGGPGVNASVPVTQAANNRIAWLFEYDPA